MSASCRRLVAIFLGLLCILLSTAAFSQESLPWTKLILGNLLEAERIVLACDISGSINRDEEADQKEWLQSIADSLWEAGWSGEIAVIAFANDVYEIVSPNWFEFIEDEIHWAIDGIEAGDGATYTLGAFRYALEYACPNATLVITTDGLCNLTEPYGETDSAEAVEQTLSAAAEFKDRCGEVLVVPTEVEDEEARDFLQAIATPGRYLAPELRLDLVGILAEDFLYLPVGPIPSDTFEDSGVWIESEYGWEEAYICVDGDLPVLAGEPEGFGGALHFWFEQPVSCFYVEAGILDARESTCLFAYDENGNLVDGCTNDTVGGLELLMVVDSQGYGITHVEFRVDMDIEGGGAAIRNVWWVPYY